MHLTAALDELAEDALLDHADEVSRMQRECEAQVLRIAVQHAILNNPETLDPEVSRLPGRERARRFGGVGTPELAELTAAALGARPGISSGSAHSLMADALDRVIRLPQLWRRVEAIEVKASNARFVARRTRDLAVDQAAYVDERSAESADGRIPWSRFEDLVTRLIVASDPGGGGEARARECCAPGGQPAPLHPGRDARLRHPGTVPRRGAREQRAVAYWPSETSARGRGGWRRGCADRWAGRGHRFGERAAWSRRAGAGRADADPHGHLRLPRTHHLPVDTALPRR